MDGGFLIDMDGVLYRGTELIPGAVEFIRLLLEHRIPFTFLTNNSQRSRRDVTTKLRRMGIPIEERHVFTCAMATAVGAPDRALSFATMDTSSRTITSPMVARTSR